MEHESFEDAEAARAINAAFVPIKVDREERPDVDGVYMAAVLAATGRGGWPLTALLTPDTREPFWVGTYLPKASRGGRIGVVDLAENVSRFWQENADGVRASAAELANVVRRMGEGDPAGDALGADDVEAAVEALRRRFDAAHGGFGAAPKFPTPHNALFLTRRGRQTGDPDLTALAVATLRAIRRGGVYDQVGGGLHRYSTDRRWLLPHFEKMLYDQAGYALACTEAWAATGADDLREAVEATIDYVLRDLRSPAGAFFSAEDADSLNAEGGREEGAFYVWTEAELDAALDADDARLVKAVWGTEPGGNYADEATGQRTGANVLHHPAPDLASDAPLDLAAERLEMDSADLGERLDRARRTLLDVRAGRPRPLLDDKVLTDWNGFMIAALAVAARTFGRADYAEAASEAAGFLLDTMRTADGALLHRYRGGEAGIDGLLDDYAYLAWGLTELYQTTFEEPLLQHAIDLHAQMRSRFEDADGGYFVSPEDAPDLIARQKNPDDGAMPAGNSVAALNGLRLARLTGRPALEEAAHRALRAPAVVREHPSGFTHLLTAAAFAVGPSQEVVVAGGRGGADTAALLAAVRSVYAPFSITLLRAPGTGPAPVVDLAPFAEAQTAQAGAATAYVCRDHVCAAPTTDPAEAQALLDEAVTDRAATPPAEQRPGGAA